MTNQLTVLYAANTVFAYRHFLAEHIHYFKTRMQVVAICPSDGQPPAELRTGVTWFTVPLRRNIAVCADLVSLVRLTRLMLSVRPDIVNVTTPKAGLLGALAAWCARVRIRIYTVRGLRYETVYGIKRLTLMMAERIACASATHVICISNSVKEQLLADRIAAPQKTLVLGTVASEGINYRLLDAPLVPAEALRIRTTMQCDSRSVVIGFVGRITRDKGIHELVEAFLRLRAARDNVILMLVGDFESDDPISEDVKHTILTSPDIHWMGYRSNCYPYFHALDVFAFPSYREGLGTVLLEAGAAYRPVVASRTTGIVDAVIDGETGILVQVRSSEALFAALLRLVDDADLRATMGLRGRERVEREFDYRFGLEALYRLYADAPGAKRRPGDQGKKAKRQRGRVPNCLKDQDTVASGPFASTK